MMTRVSAVLCVLAAVLTLSALTVSRAAHARVIVGVGIGYGYAPWPYYAPYYYYPPRYVYPPPVVYYAPPPVYVVPQAPTSSSCRRFNGDATNDQTHQPFYGTACLGADGLWHIVD